MVDLPRLPLYTPCRHFLNAGKRLLGLSYQSIKGGLIGVEYDGRTVRTVTSLVTHPLCCWFGNAIMTSSLGLSSKPTTVRDAR